MPHPPDSLFGKKKDCAKILQEAWRLSQTNSDAIEIEVPPSRHAANLVEQQSNQSNINTDDNTGAKFSMSENYNTTKFSTNSSTADIQKPKDHHVADAPSKATLYKATRQSFHGRDATSQAQACHGCHDSGSHE